MDLMTCTKYNIIAILTIFSFNCRETSGMHPGIMINRTKAVPLYIETLKKQVQEDNLGKFSWNNNDKDTKTNIDNSNNYPRSYQKSHDIVSNSKINLLFNISKNELSDFAISKLDEKNFILETSLKEIPIANIKRKIKINITQKGKTDINIEIYDEKSIRHTQEENILRKKILNKYNSVINSMKI